MFHMIPTKTKESMRRAESVLETCVLETTLIQHTMCYCCQFSQMKVKTICEVDPLETFRSGISAFWFCFVLSFLKVHTWWIIVNMKELTDPDHSNSPSNRFHSEPFRTRKQVQLENCPWNMLSLIKLHPLPWHFPGFSVEGKIRRCDTYSCKLGSHNTVQGEEEPPGQEKAPALQTHSQREGGTSLRVSVFWTTVSGAEIGS